MEDLLRLRSLFYLWCSFLVLSITLRRSLTENPIESNLLNFERLRRGCDGSSYENRLPNLTFDPSVVEILGTNPRSRASHGNCIQIFLWTQTV